MWTRPIKPGTLVAVVSPVDPNKVRRIARVVEDTGDLVTVLTDDKLESEAAIEYDFATPEPEIMEIKAERLRPIIG